MIKTVHATIVVERDYPVPPARVFAAFAEPDAYRQWHLPNGEWVTNRFAYDFRIGGELLAGFGKPGESRYVNKGRFEDIVPNERIVSAGTMHDGDTRLSSTLCTIELRAEKGGTRLKLTDQSVFYDWETPGDRRGGWTEITEKLAHFLQHQPA
ncbi:MAG: SRPBCC domain-containing protein [Alphaproteobacteria bacterium]|nr:SRPBCC domain-containing protein [Alphaproteobacteria bacterium]